jgi:hypothetical protein
VEPEEYVRTCRMAWRTTTGSEAMISTGSLLSLLSLPLSLLLVVVLLSLEPLSLSSDGGG